MAKLSGTRLPIDTVLIACGPGAPEAVLAAWATRDLRHVAAPAIGSAFADAALDSALTREGRTTLLLAGAPDAVAATAIDAVALGYRVVVEAGSAGMLRPGLDLALADEPAILAAAGLMKRGKNG